MKIFRSIEDYNLNQRTILTIGTFDGVHEGHKKILNKLISSSKKKNLSSVVLTFFPHPRIILNKYNEVKMIDTLDEKIKAFEKLGIENLIIHPFDKSFSLLSADQFIKDYLIEKLKINHIIIGYDHRFGKGREASVDDLKKYGEQMFIQGDGQMTVMVNPGGTLLPGVIKVWANPKKWTFSITIEDPNPNNDVMCLLTSGVNLKPNGAPIKKEDSSL